jgi:CRISPR-associated protein Cmr5
MSQQRSLEQERAKAAWEKVSAAKKQKKDDAEKYGQLAKAAPADIQSNGLGQTLAFWRAKGEAHHKALLNDVSEWVKSRIQFTQPPTLLEWIVQKASTDEYRRATAEAMAFLVWVKRFAEAELEVKDGVPNSREER